MAGIYVHIPFCKKRCAYCDFFSTTLLARRKEYVEAVLKEIEQRKDEANEPIRTIYIGGGTPSTLMHRHIRRLLEAIGTQDATEITMELNPGDITYPLLRGIREAGVNRLSIGIQSFQPGLLQRIGRRHNGMEAFQAVQMAKYMGFDNISIDLMYALPTQTWESWKEDIGLALALNVQHISAYGLIYEEGTELTRRVQSGEMQAIDEETENAMYDYLCEQLKKAGFVHYEVSNFALPGYEAKHNSSYWDGRPYIGVGAGAHSYIGHVRSWNPSNLSAYIRGIQAGTLLRESETLTDTDRYNERIMLGLRTRKGVKRSEIQGDITPHLEAGNLRRTTGGRIVATQQGLHILNTIIEDLMI